LNKQPNYQIEQCAATITNQNKRLMTNRTCRFSSVAAVQLMSCFPCCSFVRVGLPRSYREHLTPFPSEWRPVFSVPFVRNGSRGKTAGKKAARREVDSELLRPGGAQEEKEQREPTKNKTKRIAESLGRRQMALIVSHGRCQQTIGRAAEGNGVVGGNNLDRHTKGAGIRPTVRSTKHNQWHLLDDVENSFVLVQPQVMVGYCHGLERDLFGIFEVRIRSPHALQPLDVQQPGQR
jgi:hypothetical protein